MADKIQCPKCQASLDVMGGEEPRPVRCNACGEVVSAAAIGALVRDTDRNEGGAWRMKTPEGRVYGPIPRAELDAWVADGRVTSGCQLSQGSGDWISATQRYPQLAEVVQASPDSGAADAGSILGVRPHRGLLIIVLAVTGWVTCCPAFSIAAWVLGTRDLHAMRAGQLDKSGLGNTYAGQVLGMVHGVITITLIVLVIFGLVVQLVMAL